MRYCRTVMLGAIAAAIGIVQVQAQPGETSTKRNQCFFLNQMDGWRAPDDKTLYIRAGLNRYYRLDLGAACHKLKWPRAHLITKARGSDMVCSPLDWDLSVAETPDGIPEQCIVKAMTPLTPEEVAAIPQPFKP